ncbi:MAG: hypothetical protein ACYC4L_15265 [Chloroflexota bacterium]
MPTPTPKETPANLARDLAQLAADLAVEGQGADTLPAAATAARVQALAVRAAVLHLAGWTLRRAGA